ncbi:MAG: glycan-binding surface protein [Prevotellaceae bacterium]|jgi:hypothetical protein|nr:glycan-binding surface protein [Prevotellaceae bacterium]
MKTLKKIFPFFALLSFCVGVFSSCEDDDCGCNPVISHILPSKAVSKDSIIVGANAEEYIVIVGENLAAVTQVLFDNEPATLNSSFITDNHIVLQIPAITSSTTRIRLITAQGRQVESAFAINIPPPVIKSFYCEFVPEGGILRVKGDWFLNPNVFFYGENDVLIPAEVKVDGRTELFVKVPAGVVHSKPIIVETASGQKSSFPLLFRDKTNLIIDFDEFRATVSGTMEPGGTGGDNPLPKWKDTPDMLALVPDGFDINNDLPEGCDGLYDQVGWKEAGALHDGCYIAYHVENGGRDQKPLAGIYSSVNVMNLVLKFEVYVPSEFPINGIYADLCFPKKGNNGAGTEGRDISNSEDPAVSIPGGWWCPFEAGLNTGEPSGWLWEIGVKVKTPFSTDWSKLEYEGKWMTVSVPLETFRWNLQAKGINSIMEQKFAVGAGYPYEAVTYPLSTDWTKSMGDFTFMWEPWGASGQVGSLLCFVDNFRVVPEDGSGVRHGKIGQRGNDGNRDLYTGGRPY